MFNFEKLEVWQLARKLVKEIYLITIRFPDEEKFGLVNQLRRAAVSVASNLAEGGSRNTNKDQAHFTQMAYSSLMEVANQLILSHDLGYIDHPLLNDITKQIKELALKLSALRKTQLARKS